MQLCCYNLIVEIKRIKEVNQELINELNKTFVKGEPESKSEEWNLNNAKEFVDNPDNIFLLAYLENEIAGMLSAYKLQRMDCKRNKIFFYEIGVIKNYRQKGVGRGLIEELKNIARDMDVCEMFVLTNRSNIAAMKLYETTGGVVSKEDDEVMFAYKI